MIWDGLNQSDLFIIKVLTVRTVLGHFQTVGPLIYDKFDFHVKVNNAKDSRVCIGVTHSTALLDCNMTHIICGILMCQKLTDTGLTCSSCKMRKVMRVDVMQVDVMQVDEPLRSVECVYPNLYQ